jgi:hypothetical protein
MTDVDVQNNIFSMNIYRSDVMNNIRDCGRWVR